MAKRLEQRKQLQTSILLTGGDTDLLTQKELVDKQLLTQTNRWTAEGNDEFMLGAMTPEVVVPQDNNTWL